MDADSFARFLLDNRYYGPGSHIEDGGIVGSNCKFSANHERFNNVTFGEKCRFGTGNSFSNCRFGNDCRFWQPTFKASTVFDGKVKIYGPVEGALEKIPNFSKWTTILGTYEKLTIACILQKRQSIDFLCFR